MRLNKIIIIQPELIIYLIREPSVLSLIYPEPGMFGFPDFLIYVPTEINSKTTDYTSIYNFTVQNLYSTTQSHVSGVT